MSDDDAIDFLLKTLETQGAAVSSVKDGHVILLSRKTLQEMMDKYPEKDKFIIFVKQPEFKN